MYPLQLLSMQYFIASSISLFLASILFALTFSWCRDKCLVLFSCTLEVFASGDDTFDSGGNEILDLFRQRCHFGFILLATHNSLLLSKLSRTYIYLSDLYLFLNGSLNFLLACLLAYLLACQSVYLSLNLSKT